MQKDDLKRLAEDLLSLEVNTIISDEISAEKMPEKNRITLYTLANDYGQELIAKELEYPDQTFDFRGKIEWPFGGMLSYDELRQRSKAAAATLSKYLADLKKARSTHESLLLQVRRDIMLFQNIESNCSRMVGMFKIKGKEATGSVPAVADLMATSQLSPDEPDKDPGHQYAPHLDSVKWNNDIGWNEINTYPDLPLKAHEITRLRKAWDIGTEQIVMQTTITLDGDVTTRLAQQFAANPQKFVMDLHNGGINTSLGYWDGLMKVLGSVFKHMGGLLTGSKSS